MEYNFRYLLESAIGGCQYSYLHGKLDEDLRQYIIVHIIKKLPKFRI